jgi:hypothetical protein
VTAPRTPDHTRRWSPPLRPKPGSQAERRAVQDIVARLDAQAPTAFSEPGWAASVPGDVGVYLIRDARGVVLLVGCAVDEKLASELRREANRGAAFAAIAIDDRRITLLTWHLAVGHLLPQKLNESMG